MTGYTPNCTATCADAHACGEDHESCACTCHPGQPRQGHIRVDGRRVYVEGGDAVPTLTPPQRDILHSLDLGTRRTTGTDPGYMSRVRALARRGLVVMDHDARMCEPYSVRLTEAGYDALARR